MKSSYFVVREILYIIRLIIVEHNQRLLYTESKVKHRLNIFLDKNNNNSEADSCDNYRIKKTAKLYLIPYKVNVQAL